MRGGRGPLVEDRFQHTGGTGLDVAHVGAAPLGVVQVLQALVEFCQVPAALFGDVAVVSGVDDLPAAREQRRVAVVAAVAELVAQGVSWLQLKRVVRRCPDPFPARRKEQAPVNEQQRRHLQQVRGHDPFSRRSAVGGGVVGVVLLVVGRAPRRPRSVVPVVVKRLLLSSSSTQAHRARAGQLRHGAGTAVGVSFWRRKTAGNGVSEPF